MSKFEVNEEILDLIHRLYLDYYYECFENEKEPIKFGKYAIKYLEQKDRLMKFGDIEKERLN